jgi:hypothetical protein
MLHAVLAILGALALYGLVVFVKPDHACGCSGRCSRCKGTGRRFWPGARLVRAAAMLAHEEARKRWGRT